jgi:hypothetical protein
MEPDIMKISINNASEFRNQFVAYNRDYFTCQGYELLFDYFEDVDPDMVLDVIAICCDYAEDTVEGIARNYSIDLNDANPEDDDYDDQCRQIIFDYLSDRTSVVGDTADGFVYLSF